MRLPLTSLFIFDKIKLILNNNFNKMNYKIVILLILVAFLGASIDRILVEYTTAPCDNNTTNLENSNCAENNNSDKKNTGIKYKTFSSPRANFTFEYPDTWVYEEKQNAYNTNETNWIFYSNSKTNSNNLIFITGTYNADWVDFCSIGYKGTKIPYQLNTFSTNNLETFVTYEQCGNENGKGYIYWEKGEYFASANNIKDIQKINLMVYNFDNKNINNVVIAQHIAQSIRIK